MTHKTMTIGLVLASVPGYSETFFRNKIKGLQQNGFEVMLFVYNSKETFDLCQTYQAPVLNGNRLTVAFNSVKSLFKAVFFHPRRSLKLFQLEKKGGKSFIERIKSLITNQFILSKKLDWLHFGFGTMALGSEYVAQALGAKMAVSFRGFDIGVYPIKYPKCYAGLWEKVTKIHVLSEDIRQLVYAQGFRDQVPLVKITPAIDTHYFSAAGQVHTKEPVQLLTVARLHWKKGLNYTLEALALLKQAGVSFEYRIIGAGPEAEALKFACYQLGLQERVFFLGKLAPDEVKQYLAKSQLYLQYSVQEGFCNAVLEAQAMGLLCVVSDAEGLGENVLHGQTGWVVPKRQPPLLAAKIKEVMGLPAIEKQQVRACAVGRVQDQFGIEKQQQEFVRFYAT